MESSKSYKSYTTLTYNNQKFIGLDELHDLCKRVENSEFEWERAIGVFLREWFDDSNNIELLTSGSTGQPKRILVAKDAMIASASRTLSFFNLQKNDKALLALSANYIAGKMMIVRAMVGQLNLLCFGIDSNPLQHLNEEIKFTALVPTQVWSSIKESKDKFNLIDKLIIGGAAVGKEMHNKLSNLGSNAWETYGMTETVSHIALGRISSETKQVFELLKDVKIGIDNRSCLYVEKSDINQEKIQTNDIVELVSDNKFIFKGRYDNVINTGGIKVFPEEVERILEEQMKDPFVISSVPDKKWGQMLVIVFENSSKISINECDFKNLKKYQIPKKAFYLNCFPRTESGKVKRNIVRDLILRENKTV